MPSQSYTVPRLLPLGDAAWTMEFGESIDVALHARVMRLAHALEEFRSTSGLPGVIEWVPTFRSLTVYFDPLLAEAGALAATLLQLDQSEGCNQTQGRRWLLPVCFGGDAGPDLEDMADAVALHPAEVVTRITATVFRVYMLGFMPGFPYMGGLAAELSMPRLATPRKIVPARSLAVAGGMCAIYPWESPGGWRLIGRTPVRIFELGARAAPALFAPGDEAMWLPIDVDLFRRLDEQAARGELAWEQFQLGGGRTLAGQLTVIDGGLASTIQDAGRRGYRSLGVPLSGALDGIWLSCANALVGNPPDRPALEMRVMGASLAATREKLCVGLAGNADWCVVRADGQRKPISGWRSMVLEPGDTVKIGTIRSGVGYLAVSGGIAVPAQLGSCSTYARAELGGMDGRPLRRGDVLPIADTGAAAWVELAPAGAFEHARGSIRVLFGPQADYFTAETLAAFEASEYLVTRDSDRMGIRLSGRALAHQAEKGADLISDAVSPGAIQVPADGQPILLLADCQTVGGYPKIATVIQADLPRLAHLLPGQAIGFSAVTREAARLALQAQREALSAWLAELAPYRQAGHLNQAALYGSNLISGMVDAEET